MRSQEETASSSLATEMALMRRDVGDIRLALYGNGNTNIGLIARVEALSDAADRGRWALKSILWLGGSLVAVMTALAQMRQTWTTWLGHG